MVTLEMPESQFLSVAEVQDEDIIKILGSNGQVESFGKKKLQLIVEQNGHEKLMNINRKQTQQLQGLLINVLELPVSVVVKKRVYNGGETLDFDRLVIEI